MTLDQLKTFCSKDDTRPKLMQPFVIGNTTYATDGRIIAWVFEKLEGVADAEESFVHNVLKVVSQHPSGNDTQAIWEKMPPVKEVKFKDCAECDGKGKYPEAPETICEDCEGTGRTAIISPTDIGHRQFNDHYLALIAAIHDVEIAPAHGLELEPLPFRFRHGCGLLMAMRKS